MLWLGPPALETARDPRAGEGEQLCREGGRSTVESRKRFLEWEGPVARYGQPGVGPRGSSLPAAYWEPQGQLAIGAGKERLLKEG